MQGHLWASVLATAGVAEVTFDHRFQREEADNALKTAHRLVLLVLMIQAVHFAIDNLVQHWQVPNQVEFRFQLICLM
jgi:hypothetical protein